MPAFELSGRKCVASLCHTARKQIREYEHNVDRKQAMTFHTVSWPKLVIFIFFFKWNKQLQTSAAAAVKGC